MQNGVNDAFALAKNTVPVEEDTDIVAALEKDLRSEKKQEVKTEQSQQLGGSGIALPDAPGENEYLKQKAEKYAMQDDIKPGYGTNSCLGDFSFLLDMQSMAAEQNSSFASSQSMAMAFATLASQQSSPQKIVESQTAYNLAASQFGMAGKERKGIQNARKNNKFANNSVYH
jgi:hypothetical protein